MKLDDNAAAMLAKVSDLIEHWREEALDRYAWEVNHQREDMRVLIMARAVREQLEQCVAEMRAIVGWPCNGDGDGNDSDAHSLTSIRALILAAWEEVQDRVQLLDIGGRQHERPRQKFRIETMTITTSTIDETLI